MVAIGIDRGDVEARTEMPAKVLTMVVTMVVKVPDIRPDDDMALPQIAVADHRAVTVELSGTGGGGR